MVNLPWGSDIPPVSRFRLLVASAVLGAVVAVGAIAFLAACQVVTRLALTQCAGYQDAGLAGETVFVPSAVGGVRHGLRPPAPPALPLLRSPIAGQEVAARVAHFSRTNLVDLFCGIGFAWNGHLGVISLPP